MLEILGWLLLALAAFVVVVLVIASRRPDRFDVQRTLRIGAPPERVFPLINDIKVMNTWNPFALRDPSAKGDYEGPSSGPGARHTFAGPKSGTGFIEITDAVPPSKVVMRLWMSKPFKADNTVTFTVAPVASSSDVTWAMSGKQPLLAKAMTLFIDCDKMVGREFEQGLASLKATAERA